MGRKRVAYECLKILIENGENVGAVFTFPECGNLIERCNQNKIPLYFNLQYFETLLESHKIDVAFGVSYNKIIPKKYLDKLRFVN